MATKKQKRAAAEAKHQAFMDEYRRSGLNAQNQERARRDREKRQAEAESKRRKDSEASKTLNAIFKPEVDDDESSLEMECI